MSKKNRMICLFGVFVVTFVTCLALNFYPNKDKSVVNEYMQEYDPDTYEPIYPHGGDWSNTKTVVHANPDWRAWITIPGTSISYPVCQAADNDYYLNHDFDGRMNKNGCIFLDYQSNTDDKNKVVYGHNLGSSSTEMFSTLTFFITPEWYDNHRTIKYSPVEAENEQYKVFAAVPFHTDNLDEFDYMQRNWDSDIEFSEWIDYIYEHSLYQCDTSITSDAQILTLSTCNRAYPNSNRFLLFAYKEG